MIRDLDPLHLISLGTIGSGQCGAGSSDEFTALHTLPAIDLCEFHDYNATQPLPGDQYTYQENVRKIVGKRSQRQFSIGDKVRVILDRVDGNERKLQFSILEDAPKRSRGNSRRPVSDGSRRRPR